MRFWGFRKYRSFDISERLHGQKESGIHFERLPRRKVRPFWWTLVVFLIVLYLYFYLKRLI